MASIIFTSAGGIKAASFKTTSSREKKENIEKTGIKATDLLNKVDVVDFTFKADAEKEPHIGFIAEDTDPILSSPSKDQMDLGNCVGVLIKAVQELSAEVEKLKQKLD